MRNQSKTHRGSALLGEGKANGSATFVSVSGKARFTFLTEAVVRLEWSEDGRFEDRPTLAIWNRHLPAPRVEVVRRGAELRLRTVRLELSYRDDGTPFSPKNLSIANRDGDVRKDEQRFRPGPSVKSKPKHFRWKFGDADTGNLGGTFRTLDGYDGDVLAHLPGPGEEPGRPVTLDCGRGLLSRTGWSVLDDSGSPVLEPHAVFGRWVAPRDIAHKIDLYFFGHGLDFAAALADGACILGSQPLPPRYALGYWYSRDYVYTDSEIRALVERFADLRIPLDVMVLDMDWHLQGWTGYTWDRDLFPQPARFLAWLHRRGVRTCLNLHPADGVGPHEEAFEGMRRELGLPGNSNNHSKAIPFACVDPKYMEASFRHLHHPREEEGVDFWWMDWQQGATCELPGLDPLPWLNQLHWEDHRRRNPTTRPLSFSRYGGPGGGRYPVGFSGDAFSTWASLGLQVRTTPQAGNVLFGYWSHDIGGYLSKDLTPELYLRWVQFGAFSPVLRTHTAKHSGSDRRFWTYPDPFGELMTHAVRLRYALLPYIYTEAREAADTGLSLLRPMYYAWPGKSKAYEAKGQYLFGGRMLVVPIQRPADPVSELAEARFWLPPGEWIDVERGERLLGGQEYTRQYLWSEIPRFVRPGTVLPGQGAVERTGEGSYTHLVVHIYPGADGEYSLYEDDGISMEFEAGRSWRIPLRYRERKDGGELAVGAPVGNPFRGSLLRRNLEVRICGCPPPVKAQIGGGAGRSRSRPWRSLDSLESGEEAFSWDGDRAEAVIRLGEVDFSRGATVRWNFAPGADAKRLDGWKGLMARMERIAFFSKFANVPRPFFSDDRFPCRLALAGARMSYNPENWESESASFRRELKKLPAFLSAYLEVYAENTRQKADPILAQKREPRMVALRQALAIARSLVSGMGHRRIQPRL